MLNLNNYDVLLMDLWGVLYDGHHLYPGALETLHKLRDLKKDVIFFSNVPRRKSTIQELLSTFNVDKSLYKDLIASGEFVNELLAEKKKFGTKYFYLGSPESEEVISNIKEYQRVDHPQDADFSIITGIVNYFDEAMELAKKAVQYKIPMLCTNPDRSSIKKNGEVVHCPGVIAEKYEELGGEVIYFGKPYKQIYEYALKDIPKSKKILAIGDSMENDIKGATNMGIDCALVCSGIHRHDLKINVGEFPAEENLLRLYKEHSLKPTFVLSILSDIIKN
ncbi:TIGR01459 family HAD-type hydrolase [Candidatus Bandiella numerosa]|jgi:HAD superfamily hydrolase (TIGR01459 family)|uniref:TIGR01459 family HAD-type hydrolase n=1 Tax=Candidatus Bandiella numerosa TaxID=2570586 RepID=UPI00249F7ED5|nr:TIGR01459 family HAD-type hydrolase [Candidatus Bandiella numerosa]WHA04706.1 TIGR01459 family HAD-type hydrolase [Candidatus Bandiella numerosa]